MDLRDSLIEIKPREEGGSRSSRGHDYQKDWALCELLARHESDEDYCLILEHHEDILVLDSADEPGLIDFFQIKARKTRNWTPGRLLAKDKNKTEALSILGKLYLNKTNYPSSTRSLNFVSNMRFSFRMPGEEGRTSTGEDSIVATSVEESQLDRMKTSISEELDLQEEPDLDSLYFKVSHLSLEDSATHATGCLAEFLEERFSEKRLPILAVYKTLFDELGRRSDYLSSNCADYNDLVRRKGFGRVQFERVLAMLGLHRDPNNFWSMVQRRLEQEDCPFVKLTRIGKEWRIYEVKRMNLTNELLQQCRHRITRDLQDMETDDDVSLMNLMEKAAARYKDSTTFKNAGLSEISICAMALLEYMEQL